MKKILKLLKKSLLNIIIVLILIILQVQCDLKLPEYTADIVNVGIQNRGIADGLPLAISQEGMDLVLKLVSDEEETKILNHYEIKSDSKFCSEEGVFCDINPTYFLGEITKEERVELNELMETPLLIYYFLTSPGPEMVKIREEMFNNANVSFTSLEDMQLLKIKEAFESKMGDVEPIIIKAMNIALVEEEYQSIGIDLKDIQNTYLKSVGLKMVSVSFVAMILMVGVAYLTSRVGSSFAKDLRRDVVSKTMSFSNKEFDEIGTSTLITRSTNDITQIQMFIIMFLRIVLQAPLMGLGALNKVSTTQMSWVIGVAVLVIFTLVAILLIVALPKFKILQKLIDRLNLVSREILTGLPVIRAFATEKKEEARFAKANEDLRKTHLFVDRAMMIMFPSMMFIMNGVSVLIIWVGAKYVDLGTMQVGTLMAFITYTMQIIMSFLMLTMVSIMMPRALVSIRRVAEVLDTDISIKESDNPQDFPKDGKGEIEFKDVYFRYHDANEDVLENINFKTKPGTTTAFIGSTGSGKSTLINLIPRFFDITSGKILIDGVDIRDVSLHSLREKLGFVPQKGILFSGTVADNIAFGKEISQEKIKQSALISQADFIAALPDEYEHYISQGGVNVSGGQKQRLAIARALAKDADILIFDDSFSALDFKTDKNLRRALKKELKNKTILIVASRIATIMDADEIIVLDEGSIVGKGTHKELLKNNSIYKEIAYSQLSEEELSYGR